MIKFKACGRCGGDVHLSADRRGVDVYCLQCGSRRFFTPEEMRSLTAQTVHDGMKPDDEQIAA